MNKQYIKQAKKIKGFTLIEIIIVLTIIGILAAIAIPAYQDYTFSTHRRAAIADILSIQQDLERQYILNNGAYRAVSAPAYGDPVRYNMAVVLSNNNQAYTITATATEIQQDDDCGNLQINSDDVRTVNTGTGWAVDSGCF